MMDCEVCMEPFDRGEHSPKMLPCGHAFCLFCLHRITTRLCPKDRRSFRVSPDDLPDVYLLIQNAQEQSNQRMVRRFFCQTCNKAAKDTCLDYHVICGIKKARTEEAQSLLDALQGEEADVRELEQFLDTARDEALLEVHEAQEQLQAQQASIVQARNRLGAALQEDEDVWRLTTRGASVEVGNFGPPQGSAELLADLHAAETMVRVTVERSGGVAAWTASVRPPERGAARLLLGQLLCEGKLEHRRSKTAAAKRRRAEDDEPASLSQDELDWHRQSQQHDWSDWALGDDDDAEPDPTADPDADWHRIIAEVPSPPPSPPVATGQQQAPQQQQPPQQQQQHLRLPTTSTPLGIHAMRPMQLRPSSQQPRGAAAVQGQQEGAQRVSAPIRRHASIPLDDAGVRSIILRASTASTSSQPTAATATTAAATAAATAASAAAAPAARTFSASQPAANGAVEAAAAAGAQRAELVGAGGVTPRRTRGTAARTRILHPPPSATSTPTTTGGGDTPEQRGQRARSAVLEAAFAMLRQQQALCDMPTGLQRLANLCAAAATTTTTATSSAVAAPQAPRAVASAASATSTTSTSSSSNSNNSGAPADTAEATIARAQAVAQAYRAATAAALSRTASASASARTIRATRANVAARGRTFDYGAALLSSDEEEGRQ